MEMAPTLEMVDPKDGDCAKAVAAAAPAMSLNAENADVDGAIDKSVPPPSTEDGSDSSPSDNDSIVAIDNDDNGSPNKSSPSEENNIKIKVNPRKLSGGLGQ